MEYIGQRCTGKEPVGYLCYGPEGSTNPGAAWGEVHWFLHLEKEKQITGMCL